MISATPDEVVEHRPDRCSCCSAVLMADWPAETISLHEQIDLPEITPHVTQHRRLAVRCRACGTRVAAAVPDAAKGTPFGPRVHAMATYLKTFQALSYERLQTAFAGLFGLTVSQGGLMNLLSRAQGAFAAERDRAVAALRRAKVIASDETGVRIEGSNAYHWVFRCSEAVVLRLADPGRHRGPDPDGRAPPEVWSSDRYSAQQGHADTHQTCLAHLARDVAYADEASADVLPSRLQLWLHRAFALAEEVGSLAASTLARKRRALERSLDAILAAPTSCDLARDIQSKVRRARDQLLTFAHWPGLVERPTTPANARSDRPSFSAR